MKGISIYSGVLTFVFTIRGVLEVDKARLFVFVQRPWSCQDENKRKLLPSVCLNVRVFRSSGTTIRMRALCCSRTVDFDRFPKMTRVRHSNSNVSSRGRKNDDFFVFDSPHYHSRLCPAQLGARLSPVTRGTPVRGASNIFARKTFPNIKSGGRGDPHRFGGRVGRPAPCCRQEDLHSLS